MSITNIVRVVGLLVAIVAAFIAIPYAAAALAILGLLAGYWVKKDERILYLVLAVALATVTGALGSLPAVGVYLTQILTNLSSLLTAGAVTVILLYLYEKVVE